MLEARFVSLNPFMQQMFLRLHEVESEEKRDFILETLLREFKDVAVEVRKVFDRFKMLGSCIDVVGTLEKVAKPENKVPTPFKLVGMHEPITTREKIFCGKSLLSPKMPIPSLSTPL